MCALCSGVAIKTSLWSFSAAMFVREISADVFAFGLCFWQIFLEGFTGDLVPSDCVCRVCFSPVCLRWSMKKQGSVCIISILLWYAVDNGSGYGSSGCSSFLWGVGRQKNAIRHVMSDHRSALEQSIFPCTHFRPVSQRFA